MKERYTETMREQDLVIRFGDKVAIPEQCKDCPVLVDMAKGHDTRAEKATSIAESIIDGSLEGIIREYLRDEGLSEDAIARLLQVQYDQLRKRNVEYVDNLYQRLDMASMLGQTIVEACTTQGVWRLFAQRDDEQVLVTLCGSRLMRDLTKADGRSEPIRVERQLADDDYEA